MIRTGRHSERRNRKSHQPWYRFKESRGALPSPNISATEPKQDEIGKALHTKIRFANSVIQRSTLRPGTKTQKQTTAVRQFCRAAFLFPKITQENQMNNAAAVLMDSEPGSENETAPVVEQPKLVRKTPAKKSVKAQPKKVKAAKKPAKAKKVAKIEPKLPAAAVERLRNGTSSIPIETKTLGLTYAVIQRALKRELGAAGYTALIKANRAAKSKVTKPKAAKKSKPAKAAGKKSSRAKVKK